MTYTTYTRAFLKGRINAGIRGKMGMLTDIDETCNQAVRIVSSGTSLRSLESVVNLSPNLFSDVYSYAAPVDLDGQRIIDIRPSTGLRDTNGEVTLTTVEEFFTRAEEFRCAVQDENTLRRILVSIPITDTSITVSTMDSITSGGGTWIAEGDATNIAASSDQYIKGSASLGFDIDASAGTTAGLQNVGLIQFDITEFLANSAFVYVYLSDADDITNFKLKIGSDTSNYYEMTATQTHEETAFEIGWNLIRFDFSGKTTTGTPVDTACTYVSFYMTKDVSKVSQSGFYVDQISIKKGQVYQLAYYSKYPWVNVAGTYIENSTADSDYLVCNSDEIELYVNKAVELAAQEVAEDNISTTSMNKYTAMKNTYESKNMDKSKLTLTTYYTF